MNNAMLGWFVFVVVVVLLLAFDLGSRKGQRTEMSIGDSLKLSAFYIASGLLFGAWVWYSRGSKDGMDFLTGFLVEKSLSMDNVFIISMIFSALAIPRAYQHQVLFWGILGAVVMRALMIGLGAALVHEFAWILLVFSVFLVVTGVKMLLAKDDDQPLQHERLFRLITRWVRVTPELQGKHFVVRGESVQLASGWWATPLLLALLLVESADLIFAVDSIPAIFAITQDTFIVYTSNIFAILGLRALYFALAGMVHRFAYLKYALALILIFIGSKIALAHFGLPISSLYSLLVTVCLLMSGIFYSMYKTRFTLLSVEDQAACPAVKPEDQAH